MKQTILCLEINSSFSHSMLSGAMLRAFTAARLPEWRWQRLEATVKSGMNELLAQMLAQAPTVIAATCYLFNVEFIDAALRQYAAIRTETMIFLGGPEFLGDNAAFLRQRPFVNGVFRGDESSFFMALANLHQREKWRNIPGLCYWDEDRAQDNGIARYSGPLDDLPSPYAAGLIHSGKPFYQIETSRGCVGNCIFCASGKSAGVACYSLARVKSDIEQIRSRGIREIRALDRTFNAPPARAIALLKMFYADFPDLKFHLEINPAMLTAPLLDCLKLAPPGMLHVEAGIQTFSAASLGAVRRPASSLKSIAGLERLVACGNFAVHADLIAGLPAQTADDVWNDVETMLRLGPREIQLERLKFLPGTDIRETPPPAAKFNPHPPYEVIATADIAMEQLLELDRLSGVLDAWYNSSHLNSAFVLAWRQLDGFLRKFPEFLANEQYFTGQGRSALEKRFALLEKFVGDNALLRQQLAFCRLASGLPVPAVPILTMKQCPPAPLKPLWRKTVAPETRAVKYVQVKFDYNVGDLWLGPRTAIKPGGHTYLFALYYGRNPMTISELG